jgi:hypothetical protein
LNSSDLGDSRNDCRGVDNYRSGAVALGVKKPPPPPIMKPPQPKDEAPLPIPKEPQPTEAPTSSPNDMGVSFVEALEGRENRDSFGRDVKFSRDGSTLAISAPGGDSPYVRVFRQTDGSWSRIGQTIDGDGHRIELNEDGTMLVRGAPKIDDNT